MAIGFSLPSNPSDGLPQKFDYKDILSAAERYALRDDVSCVRGPPGRRPDLPGLRYGASLEIRPRLLMLPCACAGGARTLASAWDFAPNPQAPQPEADATSFAVGRGLVGAVKKAVGGGYRPGTEPYAVDCGCAAGYNTKGYLKPGKRWWSSPRTAEVLLATPCPCALGVSAGMKGSGQGLPEWQTKAPTLLGNVGAGLAALPNGEGKRGGRSSRLGGFL